MIISKIGLGFFVKIVTGFDDLMVHIPIASSITKTRMGKIAFSLGILIAITVAIIIGGLFASVIKLMPYFKYVSASLIFLLAIIIHFNILTSKPREKAKEKVIKEVKKIKTISMKRFVKLVVIGFITAFATVIDDTIAYSALFLESSMIFYTILGVYIATFCQLIAIIYFSKKISKLPYKKEMTTIGLVILGFLILKGVV